MNVYQKFYKQFTKSTYILAVIVLIILQSSCGNQNVVLPAPTTTNTIMPLTSTPMPTETILPSLTPNPTPVINGTWSDEASMLTARSAHAVVNSDSAIYALAGTDDHGKPVLEVEAFDGKKWKIETTLPGRGLNAPTASIVGQRLYVVGGFTAVTNVPTDEVQVYDFQTQQWSMAASLPNPRGGHAAVVLDDKIHVFGGGNSVSTISDHSEYDPATNTWRELAPLQRAEGRPAAVVVAGKIYVIGGRSGSSDFGDVYIYDPETDTWSTGPSIEPRGTAGAVAYCNGIYLFGGESQAEGKTWIASCDWIWKEMFGNLSLPCAPLENLPERYSSWILFISLVEVPFQLTAIRPSELPLWSGSRSQVAHKALRESNKPRCRSGLIGAV